MDNHISSPLCVVWEICTALWELILKYSIHLHEMRTFKGNRKLEIFSKEMYSFDTKRQGRNGKNQQREVYGDALEAT